MGNNLDIKKSCEKPKTKPEIADTFNWSKEERVKIKEELLIQELRKKLTSKYPEQKCFFETAQIRVMQLGKNINEYFEIFNMINTNIFLLYSPEGKLLSYLDQNGITMFDVTTFDFDDDFVNLFNKKNYNSFIRKNKGTGKFELFDDGKVYQEGTDIFNSHMFGFYLGLGRYLK